MWQFVYGFYPLQGHVLQEFDWYKSFQFPHRCFNDDIKMVIAKVKV